jgi:hypothetical protein
MKKTILIEILQNRKAVIAIAKELYEAMRKLPVKRIINMILAALTELRALAKQLIALIVDFAVSKAGKLPILN